MRANGFAEQVKISHLYEATAVPDFAPNHAIEKLQVELGPVRGAPGMRTGDANARERKTRVETRTEMRAKADSVSVDTSSVGS